MSPLCLDQERLEQQKGNKTESRDPDSSLSYTNLLSSWTSQSPCQWRGEQCPGQQRNTEAQGCHGFQALIFIIWVPMVSCSSVGEGKDDLFSQRDSIR